MKVTQFYNKNQFIITNEKGEKVFQSYASTIAKINKNGVLSLGSNWDYSNTTKKHLYLFLHDYKNDIAAEQYKHIFSKGFEDCKNKTQFIKNLIHNKIIKVCL